MSGRRLRRALAGVLCAGLVAVPAATAYADGESPSDSPTAGTDSADEASCQVADAYAENEAYDKALDAYLAVEVATPNAACVTAGVINVVKKMGAEETPDAAGTDTCAVIQILFDAGAYDDARKTYVEYIQKVNAECDNLPLDQVKPPTSTADRIKTILIWIVVVALLVVGIGTRSSKRIRRWVRRQSWGASQLKIGTFDDADATPAAGFRALVHQEVLRRPEDDATQDAVQIVDAFQDLASDIGDLSPIDASLAPLGAVAKYAGKAINRDQWELVGTLSTPPSEGAGTPTLSCTATFKKSGQTKNVCTFAVPVGGTAAEPVATDVDLSTLAVCVAGWARRVAAELAEDDSLKPVPAPEAYGWLRGGVAAHERGDLAVAELCYKEARDREGAYYARADIALSLLQNERAGATQADLEGSIARLEASKSRSGTPDPDEADVSVDRLRLRYVLAATRTHLAIKFPGLIGPRAQEQFRIAAEQADEVLADAQAYVSGMDPPGLLPSAADFVRRTLKPATEVLTWGIALCRYGHVADDETDEGQKQGKEQALTTRAKATALGDTNTSYRVRYNLACYWSSWLEQMPGENDPDSDGRKASQRGREQLEAALNEAPASIQTLLADWAEEDPSLKALHDDNEAAFGRIVDPHSGK